MCGDVSFQLFVVLRPNLSLFCHFWDLPINLGSVVYLVPVGLVNACAYDLQWVLACPIQQSCDLGNFPLFGFVE